MNATAAASPCHGQRLGDAGIHSELRPTARGLVATTPHSAAPDNTKASAVSGAIAAHPGTTRFRTVEVQGPAEQYKCSDQKDQCARQDRQASWAAPRPVFRSFTTSAVDAWRQPRNPFIPRRGGSFFEPGSRIPSVRREATSSSPGPRACRKRPRIGLRQCLLDFGDRPLELRILARQDRCGIVLDLDVGIDAVAFDDPLARRCSRCRTRARMTCRRRSAGRGRRCRPRRPMNACRSAARAWPAGTCTGRCRRPTPSSR